LLCRRLPFACAHDVADLEDIATAGGRGSRFIAYSGEVCRKRTAASAKVDPRRLDVHVALPAVVDDAGRVHLGGTPRARQRRRATRAKSRSALPRRHGAVPRGGRPALLASWRMPAAPSAWPTTTRAARGEPGQPIRRALRQQENHSRAHIEAGQAPPPFARRQLGHAAQACSSQGRRGVAGPSHRRASACSCCTTKSAPTRTSAEAERCVVKYAHDALVAREQPRDAGGCVRVDAEEPSGPRTMRGGNVPAAGMWMR